MNWQLKYERGKRVFLCNFVGPNLPYRINESVMVTSADGKSVVLLNGDIEDPNSDTVSDVWGNFG